jgi:hypothetical protein
VYPLLLVVLQIRPSPPDRQNDIPRRGLRVEERMTSEVVEC